MQGHTNSYMYCKERKCHYMYVEGHSACQTKLAGKSIDQVSTTLCEGVIISKINSDLLMEVIDGGNCKSVE